MVARKRRYGRGKFKAHPAYVEYMNFIVDHDNYEGMPNARSSDGHINWQVSTGKSTSFNKYYTERFEWWIRKADELRLPGSGNSNERFSIAARLIHPTGYRPCRLCGEEWNVGYFYLNHSFANALNKRFPTLQFAKGQPIDDAIEQLATIMKPMELTELIHGLFPERKKAFEAHGITKRAFEQTNYMRSKRLSPGYMCNPPDRLDGFHDYDLLCRKKHDPGRHDDNLRSYIHDRRTFEWWAEGDWVVADLLYNSAGPGHCVIRECGRALEKVSPDHVGPLACGFKQIPFFLPTCPEHNSAKNRRLRLDDVQHLVEYEVSSSSSVASWQVRGHWDACKDRVTTDAEAVVLSHSMRSLQDLYLRVLNDLLEMGKARFLATLLHPEQAFIDVEFVGLNPALLTFDDYRTAAKITPLRKSLAARIVRIAFVELQQYVAKPPERRRLKRSDYEQFQKKVLGILREAKKNRMPGVDEEWDEVIRGELGSEEKEARISVLIKSHRAQTHDPDVELREYMQGVFDDIGQSLGCF